MQKFGNLCDIGHVGGGAMNMMNQSRLNIGADMSLHPEEVLVTFAGLMHLGVALTFFVLGRAWRMNNGGIDDGALA